MIEPKDAKDAELNKKTKISGLSLKWSKYIDESKDMTSELEVLNGLWPHDALTKLVIINYGGTRFPNWLTSPSFPHIVSLRLENCYNCTSLPPLGQYLPSLKNLWIEGMAKVKSVGSEFCSSNLETLHFHDMEKWENWNPCEEFPNLHELSLLNCPKLLGKLPNNYPLLNKVVINDCAQLVVSLSCFPDKCKFNIEESEVLDMEGVVCGSKATFKLIELSRSLSPISDMEGLAELEWLRIKNCEELTNLWFDNKGSLPHLPFLRSLDIYNCPKLLSLVVEEVDQERLQPSLPKALMYNNKCLQSIDIFNCDSLTHFARSHLPPTLKQLHITKCKSMRNLVEDDDNDTKNSSEELPTLEVLSVRNCPSLEFLTSSGELPTTLQSLSIQECPKLESVAKSFHHNLFLKTITISDCEKMQGLQNCIHNLTSLRDLKIRNCPSILSFPKEGFPTNLTTLMISHHKFTDALFDWGLNNLTSLHELHIGGSQHLICLPFEGLRKLTSLKTLWIFDCENLACFPEDGLPSSLLELNISNCQKLMSFPKNGLPPSLQQLAIYKCPLLEERCKKDQRGEWRRIADIPYVEINGKYLYET